MSNRAAAAAARRWLSLTGLTTALACSNGGGGPVTNGAVGSTSGSNAVSSSSAGVTGASPSATSSGGSSTGNRPSSSASGSGGSSASGSASGPGSAASTSGTSSGSSGGSRCGDPGCATGDYCDADYGQCCARPNQSTLYVDGASSFEPACCGQSRDQACGSLTHAMDTVVAAGLRGVTLETYNSDKTVDWQVSQTNVQERWPIVLGLGVSVHAPNVNFKPPPGGVAFAIRRLAPHDTALVSIAGDPFTAVSNSLNYQGPVGIGFGAEIPVDASGNQFPIPLAASLAIDVSPIDDAGVPALSLSSVQLGASEVALKIGAGGQVQLGPQPVIVGPTGTYPLDTGLSGVECQGVAAELRDAPDGGWGAALTDAGVLAISGLAKQDLLVGGGCRASLTEGTNLADGVLAVGDSVLALGGLALASNVRGAKESGIGVNLEADPSGAPQVQLSNTAVYLSGCAGVFVNAGTLTTFASQLLGNAVGIMASGAAQKVDLSGDGGPATATAVWCNGQSIGNLPNCPGLPGVLGTAAGQQIPYLPAVDVYNHTANLTIDARNVLWDSYSDQPRIFDCDDAYVCSCSGPYCPAWATPQSVIKSYYAQFIYFAPPTVIEALAPTSFDGGLPIDTANGGQYLPAPGQTCPPNFN